MHKRRFHTGAIILLLILAVGLSGCMAESKQGASPSKPGRTSSSNKNTGNPADQTNLPTFTRTDLEKYNGQNGNPAYVAVGGIVYDVTNDREWRNGRHEEYQAGTDLTADMANAPHDAKVLNGLPIVGKLAD